MSLKNLRDSKQTPSQKVWVETFCFGHSVDRGFSGLSYSFCDLCVYRSILYVVYVYYFAWLVDGSTYILNLATISFFVSRKGHSVTKCDFATY